MVAVTDIPRIMRNNGWANGAALMEEWFRRPSAVAPAYGPPETTIIRMDSWALTFAEARGVYHQLIRDRNWANQPAQREIATMLRRKGLIGRQRRSFGNLGWHVPLQDPDYINFRVVSSSTLNDLTAALARFVFRVCIAGTVEPLTAPTRHRVTITEVGVYIRDSYDFNGSQFLGYWNDRTNRVSTWNPLVGDAVRNSDYRAWRTANAMGGDFIVYSDIKRVSLSTPDQFEIP